MGRYSSWAALRALDGWVFCGVVSGSVGWGAAVVAWDAAPLVDRMTLQLQSGVGLCDGGIGGFRFVIGSLCHGKVVELVGWWPEDSAAAE